LHPRLAAPRIGFLIAASIALTAWAAAPGLRIFVEPFGDKPGAGPLRDAIIKLLHKAAGVSVVQDVSQADFILAGAGETFVRGYVGSNPRVRYLNSDAQAVYGGFLSVELKRAGKDQETVWSYLVTPRRFGSQDIYGNLAGQILPKLNEVLQRNSRK